MPLSQFSFEPIIRNALIEDIGTGDITTSSIVPVDITVSAALIAKSPLILCGVDVARTAFGLVDSSLRFEVLCHDGASLAGQWDRIATVSGSARSILTTERIALNFLQRLSGVSTLTSRYVQAVSGTKAKIVDTRKTTPGLRVLEKYAVMTGGGANHRFGLADGVLIKDNHIVAAGGITSAVQSARFAAPHTLKIEVEVKDLAQIDEALSAGADIILLDNMEPDELRLAVEQIAGRVITEASGGVNLSTVRAIAESGVNLISVGALTHSAPAADISLDFLTEDVR